MKLARISQIKCFLTYFDDRVGMTIKTLARDNKRPCNPSVISKLLTSVQPTKFVLRLLFSELAHGRFTAIPESASNSSGIQGVAVFTTFDETLGELRVTQAYIELLSNPENPSGTRTIPVARSGSYEIRMLRLPEHAASSEPAIWMVLADLGTELLVDSGHCSEIEGALVVFKELVRQIKSGGRSS